MKWKPISGWWSGNEEEFKGRVKKSKGGAGPWGSGMPWRDACLPSPSCTPHGVNFENHIVFQFLINKVAPHLVAELSVTELSWNKNMHFLYC